MVLFCFSEVKKDKKSEVEKYICILLQVKKKMVKLSTFFVKSIVAFRSKGEVENRAGTQTRDQTSEPSCLEQKTVENKECIFRINKLSFRTE